jgi:hypothetical protein
MLEVAANIRKGDVSTKQLEGEAIKETATITSERTLIVQFDTILKITGLRT